MKFIDNFNLNAEKEDYQIVIDNIDRGVVFKGTNLWILVFAIFIASLGLNVNSTAVIIGAMLVSPLMGPIMGLGLGMAINDLALLRKSVFNYLFAAGVGLATSTIYFLLTPLNEAHSEILSRISPNIYDVLIALFGGFAGILATSSKQKGNVIPGVAIATALMPPLCTAGFGLATFKFEFFFGAFYLFLINSVFIALATLITTRFLKFPFKHLPKKQDETRAQQIVWFLVLFTLLPSIYFGYDMVQQNKYKQRANEFIDYEAVFPNDYLLKKTIDPKNKTISLTYGGQYIEGKDIELLKSKLPEYHLDGSKLEVRQGFAYLKENNKENADNLAIAFAEKANQFQLLKYQIDSIKMQKMLSQRVFLEMKAQYPIVRSLILQQVTLNADTTQQNIWISDINSKRKMCKQERDRVLAWLKVRVNARELKIHFED